MFIDSSLDDHQTLIDGVDAGIEIRLIDGTKDGLAQINAWAQTHSGYDALHILSHGSSGNILLGTTELTNYNIVEYSQELTNIGNSLTESGDILLYGCNVANGTTEIEFINKLSQITNADIAASDDLTGSSILGGDWELETYVNSVEVKNLVLQSYMHTLVNVALNSNPTISITGHSDNTSFGNTLIDGEGDSYDVSGIEIQMFYANTSHNIVNEIRYLSALGNGGEGIYSNKNASADVVEQASADEFIIKSSDGAEFKLISFYIIDYSGISATYTVTGYRDGNNVSGATQSFTIDQSGTYSKTVTLSSDFQNVDEVRITSTGYNGGSGADGKIWEGFNNFRFGEPVTPDTTAPTFDIAAATSNVAQTTLDLSASIDEGGSIYYIVVPDGSTAPTSAEVIAGSNYGSVTKVANGNSAVGSSPFTGTFNVSGLSASTAYDIYVVAADDEGTPNVMATPTKVDVTTDAPSFMFDFGTGSSYIFSCAVASWTPHFFPSEMGNVKEV